MWSQHSIHFQPSVPFLVMSSPLGKLCIMNLKCSMEMVDSCKRNKKSVCIHFNQFLFWLTFVPSEIRRCCLQKLWNKMGWTPQTLPPPSPSSGWKIVKNNIPDLTHLPWWPWGRGTRRTLWAPSRHHRTCWSCPAARPPWGSRPAPGCSCPALKYFYYQLHSTKVSKSFTNIWKTYCWKLFG